MVGVPESLWSQGLGFPVVGGLRVGVPKGLWSQGLGYPVVGGLRVGVPESLWPQGLGYPVVGETPKGWGAREFVVPSIGVPSGWGA